MTQRIDRKTFEVDVDYSLLNEQTNAQIDDIKNHLHKTKLNEPANGWWTRRWTPYLLLALPLLILSLMIFGFWHVLDRIDATELQASKSSAASLDVLSKHVTREHRTTRSLLNSIAGMITELDLAPPEADGSTSAKPSGRNWKKKYQTLNKRYQNVKAELDVANGKIANIAGLPKFKQPTIKRSVVVFNSRVVEGRNVVTGWNFDSVTAIKPSSEYCYLQVSPGRQNISVKFDIMHNRKKVDFPNSDMRKFGVSQTQLNRARSACTWHTGKGA